MLLRGVSISPIPKSTQFRSRPCPRTVSASAPTSSSVTPSFSISDQSLESKGFVIKHTTSDLDLDQLNSIFVAVGFPKRDTEKIRVALAHTDAMLWIEDVRRSRPVAFARATGDGVFNSIIWDVVVDPGYQGIGLGKAVMERLVDELLRKGITNIALYSEPRVLGFYRPLGFVADPDGIKGMVYTRRPKK
uniref:N-acetyltransferase domain-containing protein n=1 Tax=Kalanchoe fedtschenkoi TaxID=63787 RepID=A0A7N0UN08_KALFE